MRHSTGAAFHLVRARRRAYSPTGALVLPLSVRPLRLLLPGGLSRRSSRRALPGASGRGSLLLRNLCSTLAGLGKPDRDRLLAALHFSARAPALELAPLVFVHRLL